MVGDKGYSANHLRERIWRMGSKPVIPPKRNEEQVHHCEPVYACRNLVERLWARLKEWRAVATRYEKTATSFLSVLQLAAAMDWLKS